MAATTTGAPARSPVYRVTRILTWLIYAFAVTAIAFLSTAFFLELFNANESAPFVRWVQRATRVLMQPFRGIFPAVEGENGSVFDAALLFAIFMYGLLALAMHALLDWINRKMAEARAAETRSDQDRSGGTTGSGTVPVHTDEAGRTYISVPEADPERRSSPAGP